MNKFQRLLRYDWPIHFIILFTNWLPDNVLFLRLRGWLLSPFFLECGKDLRVGRNNVFANSYKMSVGNNIYIACGNWFNAAGGIYIEDEVLFGPKSIIASSNHTLQGDSYRYGKSVSKPIKIGRGAWIGGNCAILSGTTIGSSSVIAANSVVIGKVPKRVLYAGNPGVVKKKY